MHGIIYKQTKDNLKVKITCIFVFCSQDCRKWFITLNYIKARHKRNFVLLFDDHLLVSGFCTISSQIQIMKFWMCSLILILYLFSSHSTIWLHDKLGFFLGGGENCWFYCIKFIGPVKLFVHWLMFVRIVIYYFTIDFQITNECVVVAYKF
jgi:hypothetical protein